MRAGQTTASALRWLRSHKRSASSIAIAAAAATVLSVMAFTYEGFTTTDVDLNDGGVWVTKTSSNQFARLNVDAQELDGGLTTRTTNFDVVQDDDTVLMIDNEGGSIQRVDESTLLFDPAVAIPNLDVAFGGGTVALIDRSTGDLWVMPVSALSGYTPESDVTAELGEGAVVAVGQDGTVAAASIENETISTWSIVDLAVQEPVVAERPALGDAGDLQITLLGDKIVVLDGEGSNLLLPDAEVSVPEGAMLQVPGPAADDVVLASSRQLIVQPMDGSNAATNNFGEDGGIAVPPVHDGECIYGVWPSNAHFERSCVGTARDLSTTIDDLGDGSDLVFRERHGVVVLNQIAGGNAWIVTDNIVLVDNWEMLLPETSDETTESEDESLDEEIVNQPPPPTEENHDPTANNDQFGARPGIASPLPVLWNDTDPDGDVLTVSLPEDVQLPNGVRVAPIANDSRLQIELPADYGGGSFSFPYSVTDGRGGNASATVAVTISQPSDNSPPQPLIDQQSFQVEQTRDVQYQALQNWFDPDGDELILTNATVDNGDSLQFSPGGTLRYTATGDVGKATIALTVSDGRAEGQGEIEADVRLSGESTPIANADFVSTTPGNPVTIEPLANDYVAGSEDARLAAVNVEGSNLQIESDLETGTVTIVDGPVGINYISYQLAVGPTPVTGRIRVDIRTPEDALPPVAVRDVALLPQGNDTLIDLLQNDIDPAGGVLVVQNVDVPGGAPVSVQLLERSILKITDNGLSEPMNLSYTVSNGTQVDTGTVLILPVSPPATPRAPVAVADTWTVREGDYTTIPVLANDFSPDGLDFTLSPELVSTNIEDAESGEDVVGGSVAFVRGDDLRVTVPVGGPSQIEATYEITDEYQQTTSATVTINVVRRDEEDNDPPSPSTVTARVLAGSTVRIPIPLDGIDPDGDGVTLMRADSGTDFGRIVAQGAGYFDFYAEPTANGTVDFQYRVRDRWGAQATARVVVGIAQPGSTNQAPVTVTDSIEVAPLRAIAFDVLQNDSDPDGDSLTVSEVSSDDIPDVSVNERNSTVAFESPAEPGTYAIAYVARDARGATTNGSLLVTVAEEATPTPPDAIDDAVLPDDAIADEPIVIDVLENDLDPDGDPATLDVSVLEGSGTVVAAAGDNPGGVQVTPLDDDFQVVTYQVTDPDGLTAEAFLFVPAAAVRPPWLTQDSITVQSHVPFEIPLADYVDVSTANEPILVSGEDVSASFDDGSSLVVDDRTLVYTSALGYRGEASITFPVTDGSSPEDPEGNVSVLTIAIEVTDSSEVPPAFASASLTVAQGEDSPVFSMRAATTDPDPGDIDNMTYEVAGNPTVGGVTAEIVDGDTLQLAAGFDAQPGDSGSVPVRVTDPAGNSVDGTVFISVVPSTLPLAQVQDIAIEAIAGETSNVAALEGAFNPFANQGAGLTIVEASALNAGAQSVSTDGQTVSILPADDFSGLLQVRYTVQDRTETVERQVTGTISVTVLNRPEPPARPNVQSVGNQEVVLSWVPPFNNGSPITGYRVEAAGGGFAQECTSTTCTLEGLTNNQVYNFVVIAINEIGESDPSPASAVARPDTAPEQPAAPTVVRGDGLVNLTWTPPANQGSPITEYTIEISGATDGPLQQVVSGSTTSFTWDGLTNGVAYTFRIRAANSAPEPSEWSPYSQSVTPAGRPFQVPNVAAARDAAGDTVRIQVTWGQANPNGADITQYLVTPYYNGVAREPIPVAGTQTSQQFSGDINASGEAGNYTFTVQAVNSVGTSDPSAQTAPIRDATTPGSPTNVRGTDEDGGSTITFDPGSPNGNRADEISYQYSVDGGNWQAITNGQRIPLSNSNSGYTVRVRASVVINGTSYSSDPSAPSAAIRPFGPMRGQIQISTEVLPGEVRFTVTLPQQNGRPVTTTFTLNGNDVPVSRTVSCTRNAGQQCRLAVHSEAEGSQPQDQSAQATIPNPTMALSPGGEVRSPDSGDTATNFVLTYSGLPIVSYNVVCRKGDGSNFRQSPLTWTPPSGSGTTPRDVYTFCVHASGGGPFTLELSNNGVTYSARSNW